MNNDKKKIQKGSVFKFFLFLLFIPTTIGSVLWILSCYQIPKRKVSFSEMKVSLIQEIHSNNANGETKLQQPVNLKKLVYRYLNLKNGEKSNEQEELKPNLNENKHDENNREADQGDGGSEAVLPKDEGKGENHVNNDIIIKNDIYQENFPLPADTNSYSLNKISRIKFITTSIISSGVMIKKYNKTIITPIVSIVYNNKYTIFKLYKFCFLLHSLVSSAYSTYSALSSNSAYSPPSSNKEKKEDCYIYMKKKRKYIYMKKKRKKERKKMKEKKMLLEARARFLLEEKLEFLLEEKLEEVKKQKDKLLLLEKEVKKILEKKVEKIKKEVEKEGEKLRILEKKLAKKLLREEEIIKKLVASSSFTEPSYTPTGDGNNEQSSESSFPRGLIKNNNNK